MLADEISTLADQTAESIKGIESLIKINTAEIITARNNIENSVRTTQLIFNGVNDIESKKEIVASNMLKQGQVGSLLYSEIKNVIKIRKMLEYQLKKKRYIYRKSFLQFPL